MAPSPVAGEGRGEGSRPGSTAAGELDLGRRFDLGQYAWLTGYGLPCDLYQPNAIPGSPGETWISVQDGVERTFSDGGWAYPNVPGFANEAYDTACTTAWVSLPGQPEYEASNYEVQRIFAEQLPVVPLFLRTRLAATRPDLCGLVMDPTNASGMWNIEEFDYGEGCEE